MTAASPLAADVPEIILAPFSPSHLTGALRLSRETGWPHRTVDWELTLSVSQGVVALQGDEVVGTSLCSLFGEVATINMIIVDARMRGRGLGRKLMQAVLEIGGTRELRLTATADGLPLYEKLGFEATGEIFQHQGIAKAAVPEVPVQLAAGADASELAAMDRAASGMDRANLIAAIAERGELLRAERGFALLREFGRGMVLGPVVAQDVETARALIAAGATRCAGQFLRLDLTGIALAPHAESLGLAHAGGGTAMKKAAHAATDTDFTTYALASQALG